MMTCQLTVRALSLLWVTLSVGGLTEMIGQTREQTVFRVASPSRVQLDVQVHQQTIKAGSPIVLDVKLQNVSRRAFEIYRPSSNLSYGVLIADKDGRSVPLTEFGRHIMSEHSGSRLTISLESGEERRDSFEVSKFYSLERPGTYLLRLTRIVQPETDTRVAERVVSDAVAFTVVPE